MEPRQHYPSPDPLKLPLLLSNNDSDDSREKRIRWVQLAEEYEEKKTSLIETRTTVESLNIDSFHVILLIMI